MVFKAVHHLAPSYLHSCCSCCSSQHILYPSHHSLHASVHLSLLVPLPGELCSPFFFSCLRILLIIKHKIMISESLLYAKYYIKYYVYYLI